MALLDSGDVPYTLFATSDQELEPGGYELAWHPNFQVRDAREELVDLAKRHPGAAGLRPHRLHFGNGLDGSLLREFGIRWLSAHADENRHIPLQRQGGFPDFAINWGDNFFFMYGSTPRLETMIKGEGVYIINFHPIHLFLNTASITQYERAKPHYHDVTALRKHVNTACRGVRDVLTEAVLPLAKSGQIECLTLSQAYDLLCSEEEGR
jgi:hypothetical protein